MNLKNLSSLSVILALVAVVLSLANPAAATFPGKNGRIAFVKDGDIFTVNPDRSDMERLTTFGPSRNLCCLSWSPDGRRLVFSLSASASANRQLWIMNANGTGQHLLLNEPPFYDIQPSFSPDGSQIVFARFGPINSAIYRVQADGTQLTAITQYNVNPDTDDLDPSYSPDGNTIAFTSFFRDGVLSANFLMSDEGLDIHELTPPWISAFGNDWSPSGENIAFSTNDVAILDEEIWAINADGRLRRLTNSNSHWHGYQTGPHDFIGSWSPQGDAIVFERDSPTFSGSAIYVVRSDATGQRLLLQDIPRAAFELPLPTRTWKQSAKDHLRLLLRDGGGPRWGPAPKQRVRT